jgi:serine protease
MPVWPPLFRSMTGPKPAPVDADGTSFAAPYAASVAALMVKADPKITPDQIEQILTSPGVARHVPNAKVEGVGSEPPRDGAGEIDPVAAVAAARALRASGN